MTMIRKAMGRAAYAVAPEWTTRMRDRRELARQAREVRLRLDESGELGAAADELLRNEIFRPNQEREEIVGLLKLLRALQPECVCEIGAQRGGTLALFCEVAHPAARVFSIDFEYQPDRMAAVRNFAKPGQRIRCLAGDSHAPATLRRFRQWLGGRQLDFLFIDGDHSRAGVAADYQGYAPFVRPGGLVAFHDIVPDYMARYGIRGKGDAGQVHEFWAELKKEAGGCTEIVADPGQDGFGIGVLRREAGEAWPVPAA